MQSSNQENSWPADNTHTHTQTHTHTHTTHTHTHTHTHTKLFSAPQNWPTVHLGRFQKKKLWRKSRIQKQILSILN